MAKNVAVDITIDLPGFPKISTSYYPPTPRDRPAEYEVDAWDYLADELGPALVDALEAEGCITVKVIDYED